MWYSFNYGNVHFINMNAETDYPGAEEETHGDGHIPWLKAGGFAPKGVYLKWLEADLAAAAEERSKGGRQWIIVASHRPFNEIKGNGVAEMFKKYGVNVYFAAHIHSYERAGPSSDRLIPEILVGGAGCDEMTYRASDGLDNETCRNGIQPGLPGIPAKHGTTDVCVLPMRYAEDEGNHTDNTLVTSYQMASGVLRIVNATHLHWRLLRSETESDVDEVLDELWISQNADNGNTLRYFV